MEMRKEAAVLDVGAGRAEAVGVNLSDGYRGIESVVAVRVRKPDDQFSGMDIDRGGLAWDQIKDDLSGGQAKIKRGAGGQGDRDLRGVLAIGWVDLEAGSVGRRVKANVGDAKRRDVAGASLGDVDALVFRRSYGVAAAVETKQEAGGRRQRCGVEKRPLLLCQQRRPAGRQQGEQDRGKAKNGRGGSRGHVRTIRGSSPFGSWKQAVSRRAVVFYRVTGRLLHVAGADFVYCADKTVNIHGLCGRRSAVGFVCAAGTQIMEASVPAVRPASAPGNGKDGRER